MQDVLTALAFVLIIEGLVYALFPAGAVKMIAQLIDIPTDSLRVGGVFAVAIGVLGVWLIRS